MKIKENYQNIVVSWVKNEFNKPYRRFSKEKSRKMK